MKYILKFLVGFILAGLISVTTVLAAGIDHYNVSLSPEEVAIGETLDLVIEAVDKNDVIVKDYDGTILIFSESDNNAELPSSIEQNSYEFTKSDQGKIKFENAVSFSEQGTQNIYIYDLDDETIIGLAEVLVTEEVVKENIEISILSPENKLTIGKKIIKVSGQTQKNHKAEVVLNGEKTFSVISNNNGDFETELSELNNGENTIIAYVLNADEERVGTSEEIHIKVESIAPTLKSINLDVKSVEAEGKYSVEVIASQKLTSVKVLVDDVLHSLNEVSSGKYTADLLAPKKAGVYKVDVILKDELGLETKESGTESINVTAKVVTTEPTNTSTSEEPVLQSGGEEPKKETTLETKTTPSYEIKNLKVTTLKTKSVLTWDKIKDIKEYEVHKKTAKDKTELITTVQTNRFEVEITGDDIKHDYFAIKAVAKTASGEIIPTDLSEMTKVQTGPEIFILLFLSLLIGGFFFLKRQA
ncbi:MAG: hypothetical protein GY828_00840 [Candidatus Gracilibacteria bacterium]|nr:hypothetical protein [Candidatus Gracilibacteria bacterium]